MNYKPTQLLFIDATVSDVETLLQGALPGIEAHILFGEQDGVAQITQILQFCPEVNTVHIVSHGSPGCLYFGNSQLSLDTLNIYKSQLQSWSRDGLTLMLYGCNVAAGDAGEEFVNKLHQLTGSNIAASESLTGNANLGGNWILEFSKGDVSPTLAFKSDIVETFNHVLGQIFSETFANNNAGWTLGSEWQIGSATASSGQNYGNPDPASDNIASSDNGVAGVVIGGNASTAALHGYYYITSPVINTDGTGKLSFDYYRWLNSDYTPFMQNTVEVFDGTSWVPLWTTSGPITDNAWTKQSFDITAYNSSATQVRFGFQIGSTEVYTVSSWNLDDVKIYYNNTLNVPATISFTDTANDDTFTAQTGTLAVSDPDGQTLTYGITDGTVNGTTVTKTGTYGTLSLDTSTGAYTFTPVDTAIEALSSNDTEAFTVTVSDGTASDSKTLDINLTGVNDTPILENAIADQIAKQDTAFSFTFDANTFNDVDAGDNLTYSATLQDGSNIPSWLKFDAATRTFSGTPTNADVSVINIKLVSIDTFNQAIIANFALKVDNVNDTPTLENAIADQIAKQDTAFSFTFDANTFNDVDAGDNLTYSATLQDGSNLPNWLKFNAATRTFSGTPTNADVVNLTIEVQAKDNDGVSATDTFALAIESNNGTPTFKLSKIADDIFKISNSSSKSKLQVTLTGQSSNLVNELGVFTVDDAQGNINGIAPGAKGYAQAALDRAKVIFSAIANLPNGFNTDNLTHLLEFNSDDNFRFYLVKNSTTDAVRTGVTPLTDILFSDPLTQKITDLGNDDFSVAWKDGSGNNAADFNNLVVKIKSTNDSLPLGTNLQGNPQGEVIDLRGVTNQVKADFVVNREAAFNNFIGFYQVADENGGIDTNLDGKADILTGQAGYTEAAVRGRVVGIDLTVNNQGSATYTGTFQPGSIFAPFIITNGTPDALLDSNPNNDPAVYFPFLGANADKVDQIRLLGNNVFGFEDLPSGGDKDFNDMIVRVNMTIA
ncbi:MAG: DUF4347 domain-containing protein [Nostoc sp.]|uniref:DUF4347 domain-containing protein n=1 Tax=Nostoc sp. TaxID=1180 RepID=UPI002FFC2E90